MNLIEMYNCGELVIGDKYTTNLAGHTIDLQFVGYAKELSQPFLFLNDRRAIMYFAEKCFGFVKKYDLITLPMTCHIRQAPFRGVVIYAYESREYANEERSHYVFAPDTVQTVNITFVNDCGIPRKGIGN